MMTDLSQLEAIRNALVVDGQNHAACRVDEAISEIRDLRRRVEGQTESEAAPC